MDPPEHLIIGMAKANFLLTLVLDLRSSLNYKHLGFHLLAFFVYLTNTGQSLHTTLC